MKILAIILIVLGLTVNTYAATIKMNYFDGRVETREFSEGTITSKSDCQTLIRTVIRLSILAGSLDVAFIDKISCHSKTGNLIWQTTHEWIDNVISNPYFK